MFCPVCGSKKVVDIFCLEHLKEQKPLVQSFKPFTAEVCVESGAVRFKGKWHPSDDPAATLRSLFTEQVVPANYAEVRSVTVGQLALALKPGLKEEGVAEVRVEGRASPKSDYYVETYDVPYTINGTVAPRLRKHANYFEGTLQVRNEDDAVRRFIREYITRQEARITKTVEERNGTDYYLTSKAVVLHLAKALQERFGGLVKTSRKLFTRNKQTSKEVYRVTAFVELPPFVEGDVIDGALLVLERGKRSKYYNLVKGKVEYQPYTGQERRVTVAETTIAAVRPRLTAIHPETFQAVPVANAKPGQHEAGEPVHVVATDDALYVVERPC